MLPGVGGLPFGCGSGLLLVHGDLDIMIEEGSFRKDLYYRLNVVTIDLPPLRERRQDILPLADFFLRRYSGDINKNIEGFEPQAAELLMDHKWPGNIRELENTIERAVIMAEGNRISRSDLYLTAKNPGEQCINFSNGFPPGGISLEEVEKGVILKALDWSNWVQKNAATLLHLTPRSLNYKIQKHNITHDSWKTNRAKTLVSG